MKIIFWCNKCNSPLQINEDMEMSEMYDEKTGEFDFDLSGMMCNCKIEDEPGQSWEVLIKDYRR